jgi:hydrogenase maturation protease
MSGADVTVLGLGNILMEDEGIGVHIANLLNKYYTFTPPVQIIDGGTSGADLLPYFESQKKILIIDAVDFKKPSGYIGMLYNNEILQTLTAKMSLHHLGLSDVLSMLQLLEIKPAEICLIGIQPFRMDLGLEITDKLQNYIGDILDVTLRKLTEWQVNSQKKKI